MSKSYEDYLISVKQDGMALGAIPPKLRTPEICLIAVKKEGEALKHVPPELLTPELFLIAFKNLISYFSSS